MAALSHRNDVSGLRYMYEKHHCDLNAKHRGQSLLFVAMWNGSLDVVYYLLDLIDDQGKYVYKLSMQQNRMIFFHFIIKQFIILLVLKQLK